MTTATAVAVHVPLLDLKAQYATIRAEIEPVVKEVIESQYFIGGPKIAELEVETAKYCQTKHAIGCANGSDAIVLALQALGIKAGDAVVCPTFTFFATAGSVHRLGATPVFVDCDPATLNICPESTRAAFRCHKNIKAIVPVHLFGQACDLDAILAIAQEQGVPVVEDAAQAIGTEDAQGKRVGSRGAIGTLSYFPSKNLGGFGDGGMITTDRADYAAKLRLLRQHGMSINDLQRHGSKTVVAEEYSILGYNYRLTDVQAALGLAHTFRSGEMVRVALLIERLQGRTRIRAELGTLILGTALVAAFAYYSIDLVWDSYRFNERAQGVLPVPMWIPQLGMAFGAIVLLVAFLDELALAVTGRRPTYAKDPPKTAEEVIERAAQSGV